MGWPLWKNVYFPTFWTSCFYSLERRFFVLAYHKRHFPSLHCQKKNVWKMAIFGPKPWVYPFGKMSIFRLLNFLFLWPRKAIFRSTISQKSFSWPILPKKKELEKWPFLDQNHVLIPLENCEFLDFWNFFFLWPRKAIFQFRIS